MKVRRMKEYPLVVADDDTSLLRLLEARLSRAGFKVFTCADGDEAFILVQRHKPVILLADWEMPGLTGPELCRKIRKAELGDEVYAILITGNSQPEQIAAGLDAGADDYIVKPVHAKVLLARVRTGEGVLQHWVQQREHTQALESEITERKWAEEERERALQDMDKRIKELRCLHGVAESIRKHESLEGVFQDVAAFLPPAWRYSEIARGLIHFDGKDYVSEPFEQTRWRQTSDIIVGGKRRGFVEVCYLEQRPDLDEGPFLKEERDLIDSIARALSEAAERTQAEAAVAARTVELEQRTIELEKSRRVAMGMMEDAEQARKVMEQALAELRSTQQQLVEASRKAGMSEVATDVLHNVGNVLNSVNVSAGLVNEKIRASKVPGLARATALMSEHADDLGTFITQDERGKQLPGYLTKLAEHLAGEQTDVLDELRHLTENIEHIKNIVSMQQSLTGVSGVMEPVRIDDLLDDLLKMEAASFDHRGVKVVREYDELPVATIDKHKLTLILVNLLKNAKDALTEDQGPDKRLTVRLRWVPRAACLPVCAVATDPTALADKPPVALDHVQIEVADNAVGILPENLTKIFAHGFTTKEGGHGFGLHGSALAAKELGGSLTAHSNGLGQGATFTLELPLQVMEKSDVCSAE